ncbi:DUF4870 domain-containing protein [Candidatus Sumerlaeota bacterium]|nr:DUF4870 domain-containing protein [Candidatus Sumerlaeota bacterium]
MAPPDNSSIPPLQPGERGAALVGHLSTLVPLWGAVVNAFLFYLYRERSRNVCHQALQGIHFSLILLCAVAVKYLLDLSAKLIGVLTESAAFAPSVRSITDYAFWAFYALFGLCCLVGAWQALRGRVLSYPIVGKRIAGDLGRR